MRWKSRQQTDEGGQKNRLLSMKRRPLQPCKTDCLLCSFLPFDAENMPVIGNE
jgi:hypothetical protein